MAQPPGEIESVFRRYANLTDSQIQSVENGKAVAKILRSQVPEELSVFGAVYVDAELGDYLKLATDFDRLRALPQFLKIKNFSDPPVLSDLEDFSLDKQAVESLRKCKVDNCEVQLPAEAIESLRKRIDWSQPDPSAQVNDYLRYMVLKELRLYIAGGTSVLGTYRDQELPLNTAQKFANLQSVSKALPDHLPELNEYLLRYPHADPVNAQSIFYWELVDFGLKPTLRINHAVALRSKTPVGETHVLAIKQLYASHYFQVAIDVTAAVRDSRKQTQRGFYLLSWKSSRQVGLTGLRGFWLRRVVEQKTRSGQETTLLRWKQALESQGRPQ